MFLSQKLGFVNDMAISYCNRLQFVRNRLYFYSRYLKSFFGQGLFSELFILIT
jgi:hypothetical protein